MSGKYPRILITAVHYIFDKTIISLQIIIIYVINVQLVDLSYSNDSAEFPRILIYVINF